MDGLPTGGAYYEGAKVDNPNQALIDLIFKEYPGRRKALEEKLGISQENLNTVLLGGSIRREDGATID